MYIIPQVKVMRCVVCKRNWCPDSYTEACPLCWLDALKKTAPETQERGWQDISTAPKFERVLIGWREAGRRPYIAEQDETGDWVDDDEAVFTPPDLWMPLPSPPAQTEDSQ